MKKLLALLLSLLLLCGIVTPAFAEGAGGSIEDARICALLRNALQSEQWTASVFLVSGEETQRLSVYSAGEAFAYDVKVWPILPITMRFVADAGDSFWYFPALPLFRFPLSEGWPIEETANPNETLRVWYEMITGDGIDFSGETVNGNLRETFFDGETLLLFDYQGDRLVRITSSNRMDSSTRTMDILSYDASVPAFAFYRPPVALEWFTTPIRFR
ncbi:MAG: hypothetical protein IJK64_08130 [Clostridia bacterium]|nr:hypothetical protein [Clostridia bacterium]